MGAGIFELDLTEHVKATVLNFKKPHVERLEAQRRRGCRSPTRKNDTRKRDANGTAANCLRHRVIRVTRRTE
jgi:hypothetical protein